MRGSAVAYTLNHPDSDHTVDADAEQVPMYLSQGWQMKPGASLPNTPKES